MIFAGIGYEMLEQEAWTLFLYAIILVRSRVNRRIWSGLSVNQGQEKTVRQTFKFTDCQIEVFNFFLLMTVKCTVNIRIHHWTKVGQTYVAMFL